MIAFRGPVDAAAQKPPCGKDRWTLTHGGFGTVVSISDKLSPTIRCFRIQSWVLIPIIRFKNRDYSEFHSALYPTHSLCWWHRQAKWSINKRSQWFSICAVVIPTFLHLHCKRIFESVLKRWFLRFDATTCQNPDDERNEGPQELSYESCVLCNSLCRPWFCSNTVCIRSHRTREETLKKVPWFLPSAMTSDRLWAYGLWISRSSGASKRWSRSVGLLTPLPRNLHVARTDGLYHMEDSGRWCLCQTNYPRPSAVFESDESWGTTVNFIQRCSQRIRSVDGIPRQSDPSTNAANA